MVRRQITTHDAFFRGAMMDIEVARDFLKQHLPKDIQKIIKLDTLKLEPNTFINEELKTRIADLLYTVEMLGGEGYLYILIEQASQAERFMPLRISDYVTQINYHHIKKHGPQCDLPIVYPIVFYNGERPYPYPTDIFDLIRDPHNIARKIVNRSFYLIDLTKVDDEALREEVWSSIVQYAMRHIKKRDLLNYLLSITSRLQLISKHEKGRTYVMTLINYVITSSKLQAADKFLDWIKSELTEIDEREVMSLAQQWEQKGVQQGMQQGIEKGVIMGRQEGLEQGLEQGRMEIAKSLLYQGYPVEMVAKSTKLPVNVIQQLSDEILVH